MLPRWSDAGSTEDPVHVWHLWPAVRVRGYAQDAPQETHRAGEWGGVCRVTRRNKHNIRPWKNPGESMNGHGKVILKKTEDYCNCSKML